jgi:hypothetical protein
VSERVLEEEGRIYIGSKAGLHPIQRDALEAVHLFFASDTQDVPGKPQIPNSHEGSGEGRQSQREEVRRWAKKVMAAAKSG